MKPDTEARKAAKPVHFSAVAAWVATAPVPAALAGATRAMGKAAITPAVNT